MLEAAVKVTILFLLWSGKSQGIFKLILCVNHGPYVSANSPMKAHAKVVTGLSEVSFDILRIGLILLPLLLRSAGLVLLFDSPLQWV